MEGVPTVFLDGGNFLFGKPLLKTIETQQLTLKARKIIESYNEMRCDAAAVGPLDFASGFEGLMQLKALTAFPLLCANLQWEDTGRTVFEPYVILKRNGLRIGIIGLLDSSRLPEGLGPMAGRVKVRPTFSTVSYYARMLKERECNLIVVLSSIEQKKLRLLAKNIQMVDLYIGGDPADKLKIPFKVRNSTIMSGTHLGKYIGKVDIVVNKNNKIEVTHAFVAMKPEKKDEPKVKRIVDSYYKAVALFRRKEPKLYIKETEETVNLEHDHPVFVSSEECKGCHKKQYDRWNSTAHSVAYQRLPAEARQNLECLECHVTGYGMWGGFEGLEVKPDLTGVQCEECHGPGSSHPATMSMRMGKDLDRLCRKCHTHARSPRFNLREYKERIRCDAAGGP